MDKNYFKIEESIDDSRKSPKGSTVSAKQDLAGELTKFDDEYPLLVSDSYGIRLTNSNWVSHQYVFKAKNLDKVKGFLPKLIKSKIAYLQKAYGNPFDTKLSMSYLVYSDNSDEDYVGYYYLVFGLDLSGKGRDLIYILNKYHNEGGGEVLGSDSVTGTLSQEVLSIDQTKVDYDFDLMSVYSELVENAAKKIFKRIAFQMSGFHDKNQDVYRYSFTIRNSTVTEDNISEFISDFKKYLRAYSVGLIVTSFKRKGTNHYVTVYLSEKPDYKNLSAVVVKEAKKLDNLPYVDYVLSDTIR